MSDTTAQSEFEDAFHKAAERHERIWVFIALLLLSLLMIGTLFFVVLDYGVVVKTDGYHTDPASVGTTAPFADAALVRTGPNAYSVHMLAHLWAWTPSPLHVPQGAAITFYVTTPDLLHGFHAPATTINLTALPALTAP